ncbi:NUDIX domain-containing protein [Embleya sp. NPDC059237]|uniref:NUDIX hydrolase n=1 Tax=Embleya sp. NPDC059237 TaxID=3346784 RepID=UPI0036AD0405
MADAATTERDWLASYDPRAFEPIAVTVDIVALTIRQLGPPVGASVDPEGDAEAGAEPGACGGAGEGSESAAKALHVLLVRRGEMPFAGRLALPGGFVRPVIDPDGTRHEEDLAEAAERELAEETGLAAGTRLDRLHLEQLGTYGTPGRDPRMRIVSVAHLAFAPDLPDPTAGGDAAHAQWVPVADVDPAELAFDHARILADGLERARAKLEYSPLATAFAGEEFTVTELREVYQAVWGRPMHAGNFHRKVLSVPGFVRDTGATTARGGARGGRRARLYRAGPARLLHPALLRPSPEEDSR